MEHTESKEVLRMSMGVRIMVPVKGHQLAGDRSFMEPVKGRQLRKLHSRLGRSRSLY